MAVTNDPYAVLGLPADASRDQAVDAWRRLAEIYHPDRFATARPDVRDEAGRKMMELNEALAAIKRNGERPAGRASRTAPPPSPGRGPVSDPFAAPTGAPRATASPSATTPVGRPPSPSLPGVPWSINPWLVVAIAAVVGAFIGAEFFGGTEALEPTQAQQATELPAAATLPDSLPPDLPLPDDAVVLGAEELLDGNDSVLLVRVRVETARSLAELQAFLVEADGDAWQTIVRPGFESSGAPTLDIDLTSDGWEGTARAVAAGDTTVIDVTVRR